MDTETDKIIKELENNIDLVILRRRYGKNEKWQIVKALDAFKDILESDTYDVLADGYDVEEKEVLNAFVNKCNGVNNWRKTNKFAYEFVNIHNLYKNR
jgi:hypothetical protein